MLQLIEWRVIYGIRKRTNEGSGRTSDQAELKMAREEGVEQGKLETAKKMKEDGFPFQLISKYTGLSETDLNGI